jgi:uncharacterized membrane protein YqaE (UPF0057 family)
MMKNTKSNTIAVVIVLATAMLLNACSSVSITQRRYNRGIHIEQTRFVFTQHQGKQDVNNPKRAEERRRKNEERAPISHQIVKEVAVSDLGQLTTLPPSDGSEGLALQELTINNHWYLTPFSSNDVTTVMKNKAEMENEATTETSLPLSAANHQEMEYEERSADDTDELLTLLIFVLLAIILPPLALYLWEGGVTRNVKISLILVLLVLLGFFAKTLISLYAIAIFHALYVMFVD